MNWTDIKIGSEYLVNKRTVKDDDREFIGFIVEQKNVIETEHTKTRIVKGKLFTIDGRFSETDVSLDQDTLIQKWVKTEEQKAREQSIQDENVRLSKELTEKSKYVAEQLMEAGVHKVHHTVFGIRIESDLRGRLNRDNQNSLVLTLDSLDKLSKIIEAWNPNA